MCPEAPGRREWSTLPGESQTVDEVVDVARAAAHRGRWAEAYDMLRSADESALDPGALELLADCAWWRCRVDEEISLRQRAHAGFVALGDVRRAAYTAWMLSVRHGLRGEQPASSGWLGRAQRLLADEPECVEHGYVACSEAEQELAHGRTSEAEELAQRGIRIGQRFEAPGLVALAICWQGLARLADDDVESGAALLDEAMCSVMAGELDHHFTGWVYCFAIGMCMGVADLGRAAAWTEAAQAWCTSLPEATPYHGLCRVRQVEVMSLRGDLERAETEAWRACDEMLAFEPHLAGEPFYVAGEVLRRKGEPEGAEEAFARARELGHDPQPGLALLRMDQGRVDAAASSLRAALADRGRPPFQRAMLLAAQVEVGLRGGDLESAAAACEELVTVARELPSGALSATAATARGQLLLAEDDAAEALAELRRAAAQWRELGLRWEAARARVLISQAMQQLGDREGAELEREAARSELAGLGSQHAQRVEEMTIDRPQLPRGLTERERDVLHLVAAGRTNRQIAQELVLSEHTIARHLSNIFTKLGVSSRTAAAAFAFEHGLT